MTFPCRILFACNLLWAASAIANTVTVPFKAIVFPSVIDPNYGNGSAYSIVGGNTVPAAVSDSGSIVGNFYSAPNDTGFGGTYGFSDFGGSFAAYGYMPICCYGATGGLSVVGINDSGTMVGDFNAAFQYAPGAYGFAVAADNGSPYIIAMPFCAFIPECSANTIVYPPSLQPGGGNTYVAGINDSGEIVGSYVEFLSSGWVSGGYVDDGGNFTELPFSPLAINNLGQILGQDSSGQILLDTDGNIRDLGLFPSTPTGINDAGTIVGGDWVYSNGNFSQVQLAGQTGQPQINGINDNREIVGTENGFGFSATLPTPEPRTTDILVVGLCGVALGRWRALRRSRQSRVCRYD